MDKIYQVTWKMTGTIEVAALDSELAEEIVSGIDNPELLLKQSYLIEVETTGAEHYPWAKSP